MAIWILSKQQRKVLQCVACGFTYEQVGKHTGIKKATVKNVMTVVFKKLDTRCRIDAIYTGIQLGEISELHAYAYVEARQVANYLSGSKQQAIPIPP